MVLISRSNSATVYRRYSGMARRLSPSGTIQRAVDRTNWCHHLLMVGFTATQREARGTGLYRRGFVANRES